MLEYGLFVLFGTLEVVAIYVLMFTLFCFPIKENFVHLIIMSIIPSLTSYTLRMAHLDLVDVLFQSALMFVMLWLLFRISILYAFIVLIIGSICYVLIQTLVILSLIASGFIDWGSLDQASFSAYAVQMLSATFALMLAYALHQNRMHFSFVPHYKQVRCIVKHETKYLLFISILTLFIFSVGISIAMWNRSLVFMVILAVLNIFLVLILFMFAYQKDAKDFVSKMERG